jgi:hypothetical protein
LEEVFNSSKVRNAVTCPSKMLRNARTTAMRKLSHMMMTYALSLAPSATLAPLQYLEPPVATLLGYLVFSDFPNALSRLSKQCGPRST